MSYPQGQLLSAPLSNGYQGADFGTHISYLGVGGYREVAGLAERDAIAVKAGELEYDGLGSGLRRHLMQVAVQENGLIYVLAIPDYAALSDADKLAALQNNTNWVSLVDYLNLVVDESNLVHKTGIESVGGKKTFTDAMVIANSSNTTGNAQTLVVQDNGFNIQNSFIANFVTPNFTDNI